MEPCGIMKFLAVIPSLPQQPHHYLQGPPIDSDPATPNEDFVQLVIDQAGCTRDEAIKALKEHNNDVVNAIMQLTTN
jgi:nascent polypeptide-associated complex subunit alpha